MAVASTLCAAQVAKQGERLSLREYIPQVGGGVGGEGAREEGEGPTGTLLPTHGRTCRVPLTCVTCVRAQQLVKGLYAAFLPAWLEVRPRTAP